MTKQDDLLLTNEQREQLVILAEQARPFNDDEWGSERQVSVENKFFNELEQVVTLEDFERTTDYGLKATTDERINYAIATLFEEPYNDLSHGLIDMPSVFISDGMEIHNPYMAIGLRSCINPRDEYPEFDAYLDGLKQKYVPSTEVQTPKH